MQCCRSRMSVVSIFRLQAPVDGRSGLCTRYRVGGAGGRTGVASDLCAGHWGWSGVMSSVTCVQRRVGLRRAGQPASWSAAEIRLTTDLSGSGSGSSPVEINSYLFCTWPSVAMEHQKSRAAGWRTLQWCLGQILIGTGLVIVVAAAIREANCRPTDPVHGPNSDPSGFLLGQN